MVPCLVAYRFLNVLYGSSGSWGHSDLVVQTAMVCNVSNSVVFGGKSNVMYKVAVGVLSNPSKSTSEHTEVGNQGSKPWHKCVWLLRIAVVGTNSKYWGQVYLHVWLHQLAMGIHTAVGARAVAGAEAN